MLKRNERVEKERIRSVPRNIPVETTDKYRRDDKLLNHLISVTPNILRSKQEIIFQDASHRRLKLSSKIGKKKLLDHETKGEEAKQNGVSRSSSVFIWKVDIYLGQRNRESVRRRRRAIALAFSVGDAQGRHAKIEKEKTRGVAQSGAENSTVRSVVVVVVVVVSGGDREGGGSGDEGSARTRCLGGARPRRSQGSVPPRAARELLKLTKRHAR